MTFEVEFLRFQTQNFVADSEKLTLSLKNVGQTSVKFSFSEKATKICAICLMVLTFTK